MTNEELTAAIQDLDARLYALENPYATGIDVLPEPIPEPEPKELKSVNDFMEMLWAMETGDHFSLEEDHFFLMTWTAGEAILEYHHPMIRNAHGDPGGVEQLGIRAYWPSFADKYPMYAWMKDKFGSKWVSEWQAEWGKAHPWKYGITHPTGCPRGIGCGPGKVNGMVKE